MVVKCVMVKHEVSMEWDPQGFDINAAQICWITQ